MRTSARRGRRRRRERTPRTVPCRPVEGGEARRRNKRDCHRARGRLDRSPPTRAPMSVVAAVGDGDSLTSFYLIVEIEPHALGQVDEVGFVGAKPVDHRGHAQLVQAPRGKQPWLASIGHFRERPFFD